MAEAWLQCARQRSRTGLQLACGWNVTCHKVDVISSDQFTYCMPQLQDVPFFTERVGMIAASG